MGTETGTPREDQSTCLAAGRTRSPERMETPVYLLIDIRVTDGATYAGYVAAVRDVVVSYGGRYLVRGGDPVPLGDDWQPERIIVIEFESTTAVQRCFSSKEYLALAPMREQSTTSRAIIVRGVSPGAEGLNYNET